METICTVDEAVDPRVRRTRKLLQDALRSLFREKEFADISVQDITRRATVNRATFYAHYVDKQDLAANILKTDLQTAMYQRFPEHPALTRENLVALAVVVFEFMGGMHKSCPKTAREIQDTIGTTLQQGIYELMERWLSGSNIYLRLFPGCTKETIATVLSSSIYGGADRWSRSDRRVPAEKICQEIATMIFPK